MGKESDTVKSQLVLEICSLSTRSISCSHRHNFRPVKSHFIDWYRLLGVEEDAEMDVIRKRYHKLALQLHPDKNKHPKAEIAFKLVLEAYSCISDNVKRQAFNLERWKHLCNECNRGPYMRCNSSTNLYNTSKLQGWNPANHSRSGRILQDLKDIKERFKEEAKVMENCLKANAALRKGSPLFNTSDHPYQSNTRCRSRRESPIFDPTDYIFEGYPHTRNRIYKKPEDVCYSKKRNSSNYDQETAYDSPIFENRPHREMFKAKSTCVGS
ncbi:uncharacterized protein LOC110660271 isoform X2 [Hevea brasiliensis]|uniref:uncharacterized protein LOC110660271 isoform X2 n=1 Tax=Hevea brasiliensis TaxID=3981 RepID=UPI0026013EE9|nr:uncharacterized protein LOC110660271 isoform X2 [Hevea brasiliensis]